MNLRAILTIAGGLLLVGPASGQPIHDRTAMTGIGESMLPTLPPRCRLVVVRVPFNEVRVGERDGDIIVTRLNLNVAHRAVDRLPDGSLVTWGDNNPSRDPVATTEGNYVGVVVGYELPNRIGEIAIPAAREPRETTALTGGS